jgi:hypothetical protein
LAGSHFKIWQFLNRMLARRNQLWLVGDVFGKARRGLRELSSSMVSGEQAQEAAT